jgi:hypothetical protein
MPRRRKAPRLYLRPARADRPGMWVILDGGVEISTGCSADAADRAEQQFAVYLASKFTAPGPLPATQLYIDQILAAWLAEYVPHSPSASWLRLMITPISDWWSGKTLSQVNGANCRNYVVWRTAQPRKRHPNSKADPGLVSDQTARPELKALRAAIKWYHAEHGPLQAIPKVTLPDASPQKTDYWLTRKEVAARIRVARRSYATRHLATCS